MVKLSKRLESEVMFAQWCMTHKLSPRDVAELRVLVNRRARVWTKQNNQAVDWDVAERNLARLGEEIARKAKEMGITAVEWPGLYPTFTTPAGFRHSMLPE